LINKLEFNDQLINNSNSSFNYFLANYSKLNDETLDLDVFENGIITTGSTKKWGFYDILSTTTIFKNDTIYKSALVGKSSNKNENIALYVTDYDKPLQASGESVFSGTIKTPNGKIERGYINNNLENNLTINGSQLKSDDKIPRIDEVFDYEMFQTEKVALDDFDSNSISNSFNEKTLIINISGNSFINNFNLKGNIVLLSKTDLIIGKNNSIEDILIIAPSVTVEDYFTGNMQIVAKKTVEINKNVQLKYPSSIYVENDIDSVKVTIKEHTKIAGGIVINGNTYNGSLKRQLIIKPNTEIVGDVYCYGRTMLEGQIKGTIFTDRFYLKTKSAEYENMIQNCKIYSDSLPKHFVRLPLFNNSKNSKYEIVKEF
jgi:cytoskeletal protein CcmA (bactofilin family)